MRIFSSSAHLLLYFLHFLLSKTNNPPDLTNIPLLSPLHLQWTGVIQLETSQVI